MFYHACKPLIKRGCGCGCGCGCVGECVCVWGGIAFLEHLLSILIFMSNLNFSSNGMDALLSMLQFSMTSQCCTIASVMSQ